MDQEQAAGAECLHYAAASYDELVLLASWLRQHQIRGGGGGGPPGPGKPVIGPLHLNHAFQHQQQQQQQHMLVARIGRSAVDSGLLPLPLSLGSGADSGDDVDASFKTLASAVVGDGLFNRFGGELQRSAPPTAANHQSFHHPQVAGTVAGAGLAKGPVQVAEAMAGAEDCCLIPESPFYLEGRGGLFEFIEKRLKDNSHMVLVVAEGAGQEFMTKSVQAMNKQDPSGNKQLLDVGLWLSEKIKEHFARKQKMVINLKYIEPTYMIRAIPSNASDNVYCTLLAHSAIHGAMAGYTGFTIGPVNERHAYVPFYEMSPAHRMIGKGHGGTVHSQFIQVLRAPSPSSPL